MTAVAEIAPHQPIVHLVENSPIVHDAAAAPIAPYMNVPIPSPEQRRKEILAMVLRDDRHSNTEPEWPHAEAGLHLIMLSSEWPYTEQGREQRRTGRERQWIPVFAEWMANNHPDPDEFAHSIRDWREMGNGDSPGAKELAHDVTDAGSTGLTLAFSLVWGDRWKAASSDRRFNFYENPTEERGLVSMKPEIQESRQVTIHRLVPHERYDVGDKTQSTLTAEEAHAQFGIRADLRGVVFLGHERNSGTAFGVFDLESSPHDVFGRAVDVFAEHPAWKARAGKGRLMLVAATLEDPLLTAQGTSIQPYPLTITGFDGMPHILTKEKGDIVLGRPTDGNNDGILKKLFHRVPSTVSRVHARLTWQGPSWSLINENPYNHTLVQSADLGTEKAEHIIALQQRVGSLATSS